MTLHLPWSLVDGGTSKDNQMCSTHPNSNLSYVLSSMIQREHMSKKKFWDFRFDWLWPFNFQFGSRPKSSNHNILVYAHLILKLKIVLESSQSRESTVRKPFWDFECFTSGNPCDSSTFPRANFWPRTSEKILKHGFSFFTQIFHFLLNPNQGDILVV